MVRDCSYIAYILPPYNKKINRDSKSYHGMNLIGGLGIVVNSILNGAYPPAGLNLVWSVIALYGIIKGLRIFKRSSK